MTVKQPDNFRRRGAILIIAMVVLFAIAALVVSLGRSARTEALTAANARAAAEADAVERGAEQHAIALLNTYGTDLQDLSDSDFSGVQVGGGLFWIIRPTYNDTTISQYGLLDESSKLDLNKVTEDQLALLPGMTTDLESEIVGWHSGDSGAAGSISGLDAGVVKGAPYETVDELRLLPDMTPELLYGQSYATLNGTNANAAGMNLNTDWYQQHGLFDYFTVWSKAAASSGASSSSSSSSGSGSSTPQVVDITSTDPGTLQNLRNTLSALSLPTARQGSTGRGKTVFTLAKDLNLSTDDFVKLEPYITTSSTSGPAVNPATAPEEVLLAMGLSSTDVQKLISNRATGVQNYPNSLAWVYDALKSDMTDITSGRFIARGAYYSADIVAASGDGRAFRHVRVVIDSSASPMKIVYRRDITDRGWPLDATVLQDLRAGKYKAQLAAGTGAPLQ